MVSLASVVTGWFLAEEGGYDENVLFWHKWLAIAMTAVLAIICGLRWKNKNTGTKALLAFVVLLLLFVIMAAA